MTLNLTVPPQVHSDFSPRIAVIGIGGGGTNAVNNMVSSHLEGVDFIVANTDAQSLSRSSAENRIQLGPHLTGGLGAGAKPEVGRLAAEEAVDEIARYLDGLHMVFITTGMGGGTGTGAAPIIARMARERNILTVGVVTKPFLFEGKRRAKIAEEGIKDLQQYVDTLVIISNENLFRIIGENTSCNDCYRFVDEVLTTSVRGITDLIIRPGYINLDFADIRSVMAEMGKAVMGTGEAEGENRATNAVEAAISNPLLEDISLTTAKALLINVTGGNDMTLMEIDEAVKRVTSEVPEDTLIIFGHVSDENMNGRIQVSVVAAGISSDTNVLETSSLPVENDISSTESPIQQTETQKTNANPVTSSSPIGHRPSPVPPKSVQHPIQTPSFSPEGATAPSPNTIPRQAPHQHFPPTQPSITPRHPVFTEQPRSPQPRPQQTETLRGGFLTRINPFRRHSDDTQQETAPQQQPRSNVSPVKNYDDYDYNQDNDVKFPVPPFLRRDDGH